MLNNMIKLLVLVFAISFNVELINCIECGACGVENKASRIVGGTQVTPNKYPWLVFMLIVKNGQQTFCGGSILNERTIITAAHCLYGPVTQIKVLLGQNYLQALGSQSFDASPDGIVVHEQYDGHGVSEYDIALLNLVDKKINYSNKVRPVCMPKKGDIAKGNFTVAGWGQTATKDYSTVLLETKVREMYLNKCKVYFKNKFNINVVEGIHICAGSEGSGVCHGDSGGPLTQVRNGRHILDGIVSFGSVNELGQCDDTTKQAYIRTEHYLNWITENSIDVEVCNK